MSSLELILELKGNGNVRLGVDATTGHGCFPPTIPARAAITVFTDQIAEVRVSDAYVPHCCPNQGCHAPLAKLGSPTTYTEMLRTHRSGDMLSCGDRAYGGSLSSFTGN